MLAGHKRPGSEPKRFITHSTAGAGVPSWRWFPFPGRGPGRCCACRGMVSLGNLNLSCGLQANLPDLTPENKSPCPPLGGAFSLSRPLGKQASLKRQSGAQAVRGCACDMCRSVQGCGKLQHGQGGNRDFDDTMGLLNPPPQDPALLWTSIWEGTFTYCLSLLPLP